MITSDKPMTNLAIAHQRLYHQQISRASFGTAEEVVHWLGAVQAQEYSPTLWSIGLRMRQATATAVENAVSEGRILRTHLLRPTWHFVTADDIRWMLALTAPRVHALNAHIYRQLALDDELFLRSQAVFGKALEGGRQLTRAELGDALAQVGIVASGLRLGYIVQRAELDAVLCSGARRGKQFTYALLHERAPQAKRLTRDESLAELTKRYFTSHGPATLKDFVWWSSLTLADARAGVALAGSHLDSQEVNGQTLWFAPATAASGRDTPYADLLPTYDEYISYGDR
ncbi:MAG TPA: winged helix DNA-binding domain-containing protein, partial [Caldilineaceae bacterium]|nr:winged helix DNA-binding domain-containing protein [Caldilineaceae bacterium]